MIEIRPFDSLGRFQNDWLDARYHFAFAGYRDPARAGWGALRVWNDDAIRPHTGFDPHSHADMEIITYVREGAITHQDSLGNVGRTEAGDVQVMSAGAGITHAEYNREDVETRLFQIWILPKARGGKPFWGAAKFPKDERSGKLVTLASGFDEDIAAGALPIRQDARLLAGTLRGGEAASHRFAPGRRGYVVLAKGEAEIDGHRLGARDAAAIAELDEITIRAGSEAEVIVVDTV